MAVDLIESHEAFCRLEDDWQRLYVADDEASVFLSWRWMHSLLMKRTDKPCILAWYDDRSECGAIDALGAHTPNLPVAQDTDDQVSYADISRIPDEPDRSHAPDMNLKDQRRYSAFLPLRRQVRLSRSRGEFYNALSFAGNYWADYTGLLCDPAVQSRVIPELGEAMRKLPWRRLYLESVRQSGLRLDALLSSLRADDNLRLESRFLSDNDGATDLGKAPVVMLPTRFDNWMQNCLSANTRQKLRRFQRRLSNDTTLELRQSTPDTHDQDIQALQHYWRLRWTSVKGRYVDTLADKYANFVRQGIEAGDTILFVLLQEQRPIAVHACYVDPVKRVLSFFVGARDLSFSRLPPGLLLHAHAIEWAIQHEFLQYDLLRGDESYKYSLGAVDQIVDSFQITRRHLPVEHRFLDGECQTAALDALRAYQGKARPQRVHELYSQLLESWPGNTAVLYQYASWLQAEGDHTAADEIFNSLEDRPIGARSSSRAAPAYRINLSIS